MQLVQLMQKFENIDNIASGVERGDKKGGDRISRLFGGRGKIAVSPGVDNPRCAAA